MSVLDTAAAIASPLSTSVQAAASIYSKNEEYNLLQSELASAHKFSWNIRHLIETKVKLTNLPSSCTLEILVASCNALDYFLAGYTKAPEAQKRAFPEHYRRELLRFVTNLQLEFSCYQIEMQTYANVVLNEILTNRDTIPTVDRLLGGIVHSLREQSSDCKWFYEGFLNQPTQNKPGGTICPTCLRPTAGNSPVVVGNPTVTEVYVSEQSRR